MDLDSIENLSEGDINNLYEDIIYTSFCNGGYEIYGDDFGSVGFGGIGGCELKLLNDSLCRSKCFSVKGYYYVDYYGPQCYCNRYRKDSTWYEC